MKRLIVNGARKSRLFVGRVRFANALSDYASESKLPNTEGTPYWEPVRRYEGLGVLT